MFEEGFISLALSPIQMERRGDVVRKRGTMAAGTHMREIRRRREVEKDWMII